MSIENMKVGDKITTYYQGRPSSTGTVTRVTKTQVVVTSNNSSRTESRYRRPDGHPIGAGPYPNTSIALYTPCDSEYFARNAVRVAADALRKVDANDPDQFQSAVASFQAKIARWERAKAAADEHRAAQA